MTRNPYITATFLFVLGFSTSAAGEPTCDGIPVRDLSQLEDTLTFERPTIADDYTGYIGYFDIVSASQMVIHDFAHPETLKQRALTYSRQQCAPHAIVYPDIRLNIEQYENGKRVNQSILANGAKVLYKTYVYQPPGVLNAEYPYHQNKIHGTARFYQPDGSLNYTLSYVDGLRSGCFESHHPTGNIQSKGCFQADQLTGDFVVYHPNGALALKAFYDEKGQLNGDYLEYYESGQRKKTAFYRDGVIHGDFREWYESGKVRTETTYTDGYILGVGHTFFENGDDEEVFISGSAKQPGSHTRYFEDGRLLSRVPVVDGMYQGQYEQFHANQTLALLSSFNKGRLEGEIRQWDENGHLTSVGEYSAGVATSMTAYYEHGGVYSRSSFTRNGELEKLELYDVFGTLNFTVPYHAGKIQGTVTRYYRNGQPAVMATFEQGNLVNPVRGFGSDGKQLYAANYQANGDLLGAALYFDDGTLRSYLMLEKDTVKQGDYYANGSPRFFSLTHADGAEQREFYNAATQQVVLTQEFSSSRALKSIYYRAGNIVTGCLLPDNQFKYTCGEMIDGSSQTTLLDENAVMKQLEAVISERQFTKPNIRELVNPDTPNSIFQTVNAQLVKGTIATDSSGKHCYDLGFTEYCQ